MFAIIKGMNASTVLWVGLTILARFRAIIANRKAKKQTNFAGQWSGNTDKIPKINEGHVYNNKRYELIHSATGGINNSGMAIDSITFKRPVDLTSLARL